MGKAAPHGATTCGAVARSRGGSSKTAPDHSAARYTPAGQPNPQVRQQNPAGVLAEPERSNGGHRLYGEEAVTALRVIKAAQRLGFTLHEVAELLEAGRHRHGRPVAGLQERAAIKLAEVDAKIADLTTIRTALASALDAGCDDLTVCASSACCPIPFTDLAKERHAGPCC
ncbi:MerR family DNA-binding protein [Streptomyces sp. NPDC048723]|uniref:MerR family DNA-binding protein n=1 Tax=Streptomyces sp. NPDC048723 TaxID=3365589 RepID=UPI003713D7C4